MKRSVGPQLDKHGNAFNGDGREMFNNTNDAPQRATAAQLAARKIARGRDPSRSRSQSPMKSPPKPAAMQLSGAGPSFGFNNPSTTASNSTPFSFGATANSSSQSFPPASAASTPSIFGQQTNSFNNQSTSSSSFTFGQTNGTSQQNTPSGQGGSAFTFGASAPSAAPAQSGFNFNFGGEAAKSNPFSASASAAKNSNVNPQFSLKPTSTFDFASSFSAPQSQSYFSSSPAPNGDLSSQMAKFSQSSTTFSTPFTFGAGSTNTSTAPAKPVNSDEMDTSGDEASMKPYEASVETKQIENGFHVRPPVEEAKAPEPKPVENSATVKSPSFGGFQFDKQTPTANLFSPAASTSEKPKPTESPTSPTTAGANPFAAASNAFSKSIANAPSASTPLKQVQVMSPAGSPAKEAPAATSATSAAKMPASTNPFAAFSSAAAAATSTPAPAQKTLPSFNFAKPADKEESNKENVEKEPKPASAAAGTGLFSIPNSSKAGESEPPKPVDNAAKSIFDKPSEPVAKSGLGASIFSTPAAKSSTANSGLFKFPATAPAKSAAPAGDNAPVSKPLFTFAPAKSAAPAKSGEKSASEADKSQPTKSLFSFPAQTPSKAKDSANAEGSVLQSSSKSGDVIGAQAPGLNNVNEDNTNHGDKNADDILNKDREMQSQPSTSTPTSSSPTKTGAAPSLFQFLPTSSTPAKSTPSLFQNKSQTSSTPSSQPEPNQAKPNMGNTPSAASLLPEQSAGVIGSQSGNIFAPKGSPPNENKSSLKHAKPSTPGSFLEERSVSFAPHAEVIPAPTFGGSLFAPSTPSASTTTSVAARFDAILNDNSTPRSAIRNPITSPDGSVGSKSKSVEDRSVTGKPRMVSRTTQTPSKPVNGHSQTPTGTPAKIVGTPGPARRATGVAVRSLQVSEMTEDEYAEFKKIGKKLIDLNTRFVEMINDRDPSNDWSNFCRLYIRRMASWRNMEPSLEIEESPLLAGKRKSGDRDGEDTPRASVKRVKLPTTSTPSASSRQPDSIGKTFSSPIDSDSPTSEVRSSNIFSANYAANATPRAALTNGNSTNNTITTLARAPSDIGRTFSANLDSTTDDEPDEDEEPIYTNPRSGLRRMLMPAGPAARTRSHNLKRKADDDEHESTPSATRHKRNYSSATEDQPQHHTPTRSRHPMPPPLVHTSPFAVTNAGLP